MKFQDFLLAGNNKRDQQFGQNIFSGFNVQLLSEAFGINQQTTQRIQSQNDQRGEIIRVNQGLRFLKPSLSQQEQAQQQAYQPSQRQEGESTQYQIEQSTQYQQIQPTQYQEGQSLSGGYNGLEENFCSLEARKNIENPKRADTYNPRAGRITRLNSKNFPILNIVQMSATRVNLYQVYTLLRSIHNLFLDIHFKIHNTPLLIWHTNNCYCRMPFFHRSGTLTHIVLCT